MIQESSCLDGIGLVPIWFKTVLTQLTSHVYKFLSPSVPHQTPIFVWCYNFDTHESVIWSHYTSIFDTVHSFTSTPIQHRCNIDKPILVVESFGGQGDPPYCSRGRENKLLHIERT